MPRILKLSDAELDAIMQAARPLPVADRDAFLLAVADALRDYRELGPGVIHRVCSAVQRQFFHPPDLTRPPNYR